MILLIIDQLEMSIFAKASKAKIDQTFVTYASNDDGTMTVDDLVCAVRRLTGCRLAAQMMLDAETIYRENGGISRQAMHMFVDRIENDIDLNDLWTEMTGDEQACVKRQIFNQWIFEALGKSVKTAQIAEQVWNELDSQGSGFVGLKEIKKVLEE